MKLFGHPLHMVLIHFPSALLPLDLVFSLVAYNTGQENFTHAAFYITAVAVLTGWLAVLTGSIDLIGVVKDKPRSVNKALLHGGINTTVLIGFTLFALISYKAYPALLPDTVIKLTVKSVLVLLLIVGNFMGGSLILKDRVAVEKD